MVVPDTQTQQPPPPPAPAAPAGQEAAGVPPPPQHPKLVIGLDTNSVPDLNDLLSEARREHFDFVCVPLVHPRLKRTCTRVSDNRDAPLTRSDMLLDSSQWGSVVVGKIAESIDLDSKCADIRTASEVALKQEFAWASHLAVPAVLCPRPKPSGCVNYGRCLNQVLQGLQYIQVWVRVPIVHPETDDVTEESPVEESWTTWNRIRVMCEQRASLHVVLELSAHLPEASTLERWMGEPVTALVLPTSIFQMNRKGFPTLPKRHQHFIVNMLKLKVQLLIKGRAWHSSGFLPFLQYLEYLRTKMPPAQDQDKFERPYLDYLQSPLQPLMDNLESQTYEAFEKDPVKYRQYELAITAALEETSVDKESVVMVVGAGRGPLVRAVLNASKTAMRKVKVFAVEKNPNAVITLRNLVRMEQWSNVTVVATDMRQWKATELADILVSELLGSWGDNELSPECLDGAQAFLKPESGISIPYEYTSFVAPITSQKLWRDVENYAEVKKMETAYVVKMHNVCQLAKDQPAFTFAHPNREEKIDNTRYIEMTFPITTAGCLHGFSGTFEAKLFKDIAISIVPETFSTGMFSWFPLYIPLRHPVTLSEGDSVTVHFWRCVSPQKVWYEWGLTSPQASPIHNPNGRSYWIGL